MIMSQTFRDRKGLADERINHFFHKLLKILQIILLLR